MACLNRSKDNYGEDESFRDSFRNSSEAVPHDDILIEPVVSEKKKKERISQGQGKQNKGLINVTIERSGDGLSSSAKLEYYKIELAKPTSSNREPKKSV